MDRKAVFEEKLRALIKENDKMERFFQLHSEIKLLLTFCESSQMVQNMFNDAVRRIASSEEMFGVINAAHQKIGHGGEKKTFREAQNKWPNITQEACYLFLRFCEECHKKRARKLQKSLVNHWTYLNHFMKFCILSPLKSKRAEEVASKLLEIFLTFGVSSILQSDNGREFSSAIIAPRHPQSQGAVERLNGVVQDKLAIWIRENECKICSSYVLPKSLVAATKTEDEIEEFLTSHEANDEESLNSQNCTLRVPDVDRGPADPINFSVVVMAECEGLYIVGCRERKLASKFTAADLQVISENILSIDEVPELTLRTAVTKATGGQGYVKHVPIRLLIWSMQLQQKKSTVQFSLSPRERDS
ncbi:KRAB-A domain-containing protein 2 [Trichinella patagoniensis]|uniref:KRAB-A domain-containing protein 2 n=1 Tax=Trichinella patagoniensis TaxID=990121 RepID=A0A0V1A540_9BILA|nr:KRAB-A domain-containing protein 2 [Trichinella patagoniensis]